MATRGRASFLANGSGAILALLGLLINLLASLSLFDDRCSYLVVDINLRILSVFAGTCREEKKHSSISKKHRG